VTATERKSLLAIQSVTELAQRLEKAMNLLGRVQEIEMDDVTWYRELYELNGEHMVLTEDGWDFGGFKQRYIEDNDGDASVILDEVNAPSDDAVENKLGKTVDAPHVRR
jgi:hypothetical protein